MKRLVISSLSLLTLSTLAVPAFAGEISFKKSNRHLIAKNTPAQVETQKITPFNLVTSSYQGRFTDQGIPSNGNFLTQVRSENIQAEDLVQAAIASNRLNAETLNDERYLSYVDSLLDGLDRN